MTRYFVLWRNQAGLPVWDGPYESYQDTEQSTARRDRDCRSWVVLTNNWREDYR